MRNAGRLVLGFFPLPEIEARRLRSYLCFPECEFSALDPITQLHGGHVALLAASGALNGVFGSDAERHMANWTPANMFHHSVHFVSCCWGMTKTPDPKLTMTASTRFLRQRLPKIQVPLILERQVRFRTKQNHREELSAGGSNSAILNNSSNLESQRNHTILYRRM